VTINWDRLGLDDGAAMSSFRALRQKIKRRWAHIRKTSGSDPGSFDDAGVHENPLGHRNTHWLVRMPPPHRAKFQRDVTRFLLKVVGAERVGRALHFKPIAAAGTFAKYLAKGVDPNYAGYFHVQAIEQGFIAGRGRSFVSRTIGFSARKSAGWRRRRRPDDRHQTLVRTSEDIAR
jgi:hypothetical protein